MTFTELVTIMAIASASIFLIMWAIMYVSYIELITGIDELLEDKHRASSFLSAFFSWRNFKNFLEYVKHLSK